MFFFFQFYNDGTEGTVESTEAFIDGLFGADIPKKYSEKDALRVNFPITYLKLSIITSLMITHENREVKFALAGRIPSKKIQKITENTSVLKNRLTSKIWFRISANDWAFNLIYLFVSIFSTRCVIFAKRFSKSFLFS